MRTLLLLILCMTHAIVTAQDNAHAFKAGEWLKFRMHYGILNASYATLHVKNAEIDGRPVYHVVGHGETTALPVYSLR